MKKRLVIQGRLSDAQQTELSDLFEVDVLPKTSSLDAPENRALLAETHGIIGSGLAITPQLLDAAPNLKVIATISVGYDNIPVDELTKRGIMLCNTPDVLTETTADTGFALIMAAARRVVELAEWVKADKWQASIGPALFGSDVHGKTLGMVGFGRIGQAVARRGALGFGMQVLYSNASPKPDLESELGAQRRELNELLAEADFVCVTVPLTAETEHLIGAQELALMKPSGIFINIARGKVVDESALIHALETSVIQAAGLDVFEQEPLRAASPLTKMPNVVALPHIGSATHETRDAMAQRAVDNMRLALQGERPISLVNEETYQ
ncbi:MULTISPECIES: 2-hydroxyacid dehydrogenase [Halomonadaceae]|uniref:2-hydroxyacid dehydrogenase n=1 Tax=Halomonadaceae TaxID=28256 RepID=UPI0012F3FF44|nr:MULTISPECIES: D-glycerate dehydrogenase [Halomonas]CAD5263988.1 2-oxo-carboxylic acid reductase (glyoxalate reductase) (2-ketoaldonate reductase) [Halomonas sp. 156]CAD5265152.1 2-oxo-carboxylic acid reductase (glyoxalate reductase) (2-ketoaldonate reductase) [Halomonas sp. I3]CAD5284622.1 2-oxo-carboxylic acid reductase (glyoxalate reductase) (2-ketoaldonate reductase) [Halomonas sp. 113]CAD5286134.1 2-oxo-carboxylic acid reductase (glyoxalate reductase) (2-ketoaldonate reductase) [Halomona